MKIAIETSQKIKNMSLLCAAYVVTIHIDLPGELETTSWFAHQLIVEGIARIAVPFFFTVSGFFLAAHFHEDGWWARENNKRIGSLVIPFFIWSFLSIVNTIPPNIIADLIAHRQLGSVTQTFHNTNWLLVFGADLTKFPNLIPLWYVRCLILLVFISPLISFLLSKFGHGWLLLCFGANIIYGHIPIPEVRDFFHRGLSLSGLFYFSLGLFLQQHQNLKATKKVAIAATIIGIAILTTKIIFFYNTWEYQAALGKLSIPFLLYSTWYFISSNPTPAWLTNCSFPIYLMHMLFFPYISLALQHNDIATRHPTLQPAINLIVGFFGAIIIANLLRRFLPKLANILFGGR